MMKKIVSIILAFACASTCAVGLVACGDDKTHKPHSEVEWKAAFNAELDAQYYCWWISYYEGSESDREYFVLSEFDCDAANRAYFYGTGKPKVTGNYLFKKDSSYYGSMDQSEGAFNNVEKLSPEEFTEKENGWVDLYKKFVENLLKQYRDDYSSFSYNGGIGIMHYDSIHSVNYKIYKKHDTTLTVPTLSNNEVVDVVYDVKTVEVELTDSGDLFSIIFTDIIGGTAYDRRLKFEFRPYDDYSGNSLRERIDDLVLPDEAKR